LLLHCLVWFRWLGLGKAKLEDEHTEPLLQ
jgi:hypothetical protein